MKKEYAVVPLKNLTNRRYFSVGTEIGDLLAKEFSPMLEYEIHQAAYKISRELIGSAIRGHLENAMLEYFNKDVIDDENLTKMLNMGDVMLARVRKVQSLANDIKLDEVKITGKTYSIRAILELIKYTQNIMNNAQEQLT